MLMKTKQLTKLFAMLLILIASTIGQQAWAQTTWTVESSTSGNVTTFTVKRSKKGTAERVIYRTVDISAINGLNYGRASGTLNFGVNDTEMTVRVTEIAAGSVSNLRDCYQSGLVREYRFEVLNDYGFTLAEKTQQIDYGTAYKFSNEHINRGVTDLAYFTLMKRYYTDCRNYYDVAYAPSTDTFITVTDAGYSQAVHTVSTDGIFTNYGLSRDYLTQIGDKLYATVCLASEDIADGYHYIQILADNASTCDTDDNNGTVSTPLRSLYKAAFEDYIGSGINFGYWLFPHRYDYQTLEDAVNAGVSNDEIWDNYNKLYQQKFHEGLGAAHPSFRAANSGSLLLLPSVENLNIRFDASGSDSDDWKFQDLFVRLALSDEAAPTLMNAYVGQGPYYKHNRFTVSLLFSEIVDGYGTVLHTSWGDLNCVQNNQSKTNLLTFSGIITANAGTTLSITGLEGTVTDLIGNAFQGLEQQTFSNCTVVALPAPRMIGGIYQISNVNELYSYADILATNPTASAVLTADIDISNVNANNPLIAMGGTNGLAGTFDGQGHTISGIQNFDAVNGYSGLFGKIAATGKVCKLNLAMDLTQVPIASTGGICGLNLGTIEQCSVGGTIITSLTNASSATTSTYFGGVCAENRGTVRNCYTTADMKHKWENAPAGGLVGKNTGTMENCHYYGTFTSQKPVTRGAVCAENTGTVRNCYARNLSSNYFSSAIGSDSGTAESTELWAQSQFDSGRVCFLLNGGVTDGTQVWYQTVGDGITGTYPVFDTAAGTVYKHTETIYANDDHTPGEPFYDFTEDDGFWYCKGKLPCSLCGSVYVEEDGTPNENVTTAPTCLEEGLKTWTFTFENPIFETQTKVVHISALGHLYESDPEWIWASDLTSAIARFTCTRCNTTQDYDATVTALGGVTTATVTVYGTTYTDVRSDNVLLVGENNVQLVGEEDVYYTFTPAADGLYRIWSENSPVSFNCYIKTGGWRGLISNGNDINGVFDLTGGTTYIFQFHSSESANVSVFVKPVSKYTLNMVNNTGYYAEAHVRSDYTYFINSQGSVAEGALVYLDAENIPIYKTVSWTVTDADGQPVTVYVDHSINKYFIMPASDVTVTATLNDYATLYDASDNDDRIRDLSSSGSGSVNVMISGRTLYRDGDWNTICLPFRISDFTGTIFEGATVMRLNQSSFANGTLTLDFTPVTSINYGTAYIVKWESGENIQNPLFENVSVMKFSNNKITDCVNFIGTYHPVQFTDGNRSILFMGAGSTLYYPDHDAYVNAFRGFFQLNDDLHAGDPTSPVKEFVLNFDGETTTVKSLEDLDNLRFEDGNWYSISGMKLDGKPNVPGIYINNGRKIVIRN